MRIDHPTSEAPWPVFFVLPPQTLLLDIAGPLEVFRVANTEAGRTVYEVTFLGPRETIGSSAGLALGPLLPLPETLPERVTIILSGTARVPMAARPAIATHDATETLKARREISAWLRQVHRPGHRIVSICTGALFAAEAGLLDGRDCTTHFDALDALREAAPNARVHDDRLFVEDGQILTSAGITAGIDLALHLAEKDCGPAIAASIARDLVVYLRRSGGDPQLSPFLVGRNHIHPAIHKAQDAITADPAHPWSVTSIARLVHASPRHLSRLFNAETGLSVSDYVAAIRLARAHELVTGSRLDMEEIARRSGFGSTRQMRRHWQNRYGAAPSRYRHQTSAS
ncbi:GlxA family transcriptional regulator [Cucumibacter marinus]|uniref:GlxA family transcriptional regulator n=1 Tax=Cucumibacter marinus TaxID=1121252 RepID=UPI00042A7DB8|nr:GlxA family transcriptional regulator [Cucumibacter marinus]